MDNQEQITRALMGATEIAGVSVIVTGVTFDRVEVPGGMQGPADGRFEGVISGPPGQRLAAERPIMSAREAMQQAIERAQLGEFDDARLWLDIARELRAGEKDARPLRTGGIVNPKLASDVEWFVKRYGGGVRRLRGPARAHLDAPCTEDCYEPIVQACQDAPTERFYLNTRTDAASVPPERAETVVMERSQYEQTPAYDEAGQTLGDTQGLPRRIAEPYPVAARDGYNDHLCKNCSTPVTWSEQLGWRHTAGQTLACSEQG